MTAVPPTTVGRRPAYRRDDTPVSREAFYAAACDPVLSCVVEACAGAGKTWMLVSRILRALLDGARPHEILAITFTRKAAGEMRERLAEWLAHFASPATPDDELAQALRERGLSDAAARQAVPSLRGLHARVLEAGRPVEIRTFHAWFAQLLGAAPFELLDALGLRPDLTLVEDETEHAGEVFRRFHAAVARDPALEADYRGLIERRGRHDARRWLEAAWSRRIELALADEAGVLEGSVAPALPAEGDRWPHPAEALRGPLWRTRLVELAQALDRGGETARKAAAALLAAVEADHGSFSGSRSGGGSDSDTAGTSDIADTTDTADGGATADTTAALALHAAVRGALFTRKGVPKKHLGDSALLAEVCDDLQRLQDAIDQHEAFLEHGVMVRLSRTLLSAYAAYKRRSGLADMADLERCALALLGDPLLAGWVQERLDLRVRHLLIDEFQDTSPLQWQALHGWLEGYAGAGGGASGQQPPGVFIVGDPKQSVYRFRRAEPRVFEAARRFVRDGLGGVALACDHTRRNAPAVVAVVNRVFAAAQEAGEYEGFRAHTTEVAGDGAEAALFALPGVARPPPAGRGGGGHDDSEPVWRDTLTMPRHEPEQVLREQEAARVAEAIAGRLRGAAWRPGEVFVLSRKRESLRLVGQALQARGIACSSVEEQALMDAPEVRDLVAVLDAVVSPRHRLALAQALRSPLFGADDADLLRLAEAAAADADWWGALMRLGRADGADTVLGRAAVLFARWRGDSVRLPPHDLLDRIVAEGDAVRRYAAAVPVARRGSALAAIDALLAQALLLDGGRYATPYGFVRSLRNRVVKATLPAAPDAVQLLTVHGAKGLEAQAVFLMDIDPERMPGERLSLLVDWPVGSARPLRCAFVGSEARCPPSLRPLLDAENAARRRETLNLLYVALTRARECIVVSHTVPHRTGEGASWRLRTEPLAAPWPGDLRIAGAADAPRAGSPPAVLRELPAWAPTRPTGPAQRAAAAAAVRQGRIAAAPARFPVRAAGLDTDAVVAGAVRQVLDWASQAVDLGVDAGRLAALAAAAAGDSGIDPSDVLRRAEAVLGSPACAGFFAPGGSLHWGANAVTLADGDGDTLVADRLVCLQPPPPATGRVWWVLAYRLQADAWQPADDDAVARLRRCGSALARLQPGEPVRCAFVTGDGGRVEVEPQGTAVRVTAT